MTRTPTGAPTHLDADLNPMKLGADICNAQVELTPGVRSIDE